MSDKCPICESNLESVVEENRLYYCGSIVANHKILSQSDTCLRNELRRKYGSSKEGIRIAIVEICRVCKGSGYTSPQHIVPNTCYSCGGSGRTIGSPLPLKHLKILLEGV